MKSLSRKLSKREKQELRKSGNQTKKLGDADVQSFVKELEALLNKFDVNLWSYEALYISQKGDPSNYTTSKGTLYHIYDIGEGWQYSLEYSEDGVDDNR